MTNRLKRLVRHLLCDRLAARRAFPESALRRIEERIEASEVEHSAEIRVAIEHSLAPTRVWAGLTPRERALEVFGALRVWDTEANNGVLVYVLLADHAVEIVADRAAAAAIDEAQWQEIARQIGAAYRDKEFLAGTLAAIDSIDALLAAAFPPGDLNPDELPNRPVML